MASPWKLRALQFNVTPGVGPSATERDLIRFAAEWGFNTILLNFDGVIRTSCLSHLSTQDTYGPDRVAELAVTASQHGLSVVPVIGSLLGHTELLPEGAELRPLLGGQLSQRHLFCPSADGVYDLLEEHFQELAALFPGADIHIGGDESWAVGACPVCRERLKRGETPEDIAIAHLLRLHGIAQRLGKRAWVWGHGFRDDDGAKVARLPKDVVVCSWGAGTCPTEPDRPSPFRRLIDLGYDVVVCPWARSLDNVAQLTQLAQPDPVLGGLVSVWDVSTSFWPAFLPGVAFAAALWNDPGKNADAMLQGALRRLMPNLEVEALMAVWSVLINPFWNSKESVLSGDATRTQRHDLYSFLLYEDAIRRELPRLRPGLERDILQEIHTHVRLQLRTGKKLGLLEDAKPGPFRKLPDDRRFPPIEASDELQFEPVAPETRVGQFSTPPEAASACRHACDTPRSGRVFLTIRLAVGDSDLQPTLRIETRAGKVWHEVFLGTFLPFNSFISVYNLQLPLDWSEAPDRLRFTVGETRGHGILYAWLAFHDGMRRLRSEGDAAAKAGGPESILIDHAGVEIPGFPNVLREAASDAEGGALTLEMTVE